MNRLKTLFSDITLNFLLSDKRFQLIEDLGEKTGQKISCVIPVYNQESIIRNHLEKLLENSNSPIELIVIDDCSTDGTLSVLINFIFELRKVANFHHRIRLFKTSFSLHESRCEDFGFRNSSGEYLMSVQADMIILHKGFDVILSQVIENNPGVGLISCRGTHSLSELGTGQILRGRELSDGLELKYFLRPFVRVKQKIASIFRNYTNQENSANKSDDPVINGIENGKDFNPNEVFPNFPGAPAGWLGERIEALPYTFDQDFMNLIESQTSKVWTNETVMRGPLFMRKTLYNEIGGYNTRAFYQGLDDHDFSARLSLLGYQVAFSPIYFSAPLRLGVARQTKNFKQRLISEIHVRTRRKYFAKSYLISKLLN
jgi:glycosyltransferase involved in cell wall biosynthesis